MISEEDFLALAAPGRESAGLEAKPGGSRSDPVLGALVTRAALGLANHEGGGWILVGIEESASGFNLVGVPDINLPSWNHDDVASMINGVADPHIAIETDTAISDGKTFVVIRIAEFIDVPVVCRAHGPSQPSGKQIYRKDVCYGRSRRKPETIDVLTDPTTWRTLIERSADKLAGRLVRVMQSHGLQMTASVSDAERFAAEREDLA